MPVAAPQRSRLAAVDNLKVLLVAWVIGGHALLGYSAVGGWPYDEVNEVTFSPGGEAVLSAILGPTGLFLIGTFFFISGLFTPDSLWRKGKAKFIQDRLFRLGLPLIISMLLVWPLSLWVAYRAAEYQVSPWWVFIHRDPFLDSGSLWFVEMLLIFSVIYAMLGGPTPGPRWVSGRRLVLAVGLIAIATFVIRLWFPARSGQIGDLHVWWWPQLAGMFVLGAAAARAGYATLVPKRIWRGSQLIAIAAFVSVPVIAISSGVVDVASQAGPFLGGWRWQALLTALVESVLVVGGSVWLLGLAQHLMKWNGPLATALSQGAFIAFVIQGPVLIMLAVAVRSWPVPAELKGFVVGAAAIVVSFTVGWLVKHPRWSKSRTSAVK